MNRKYDYIIIGAGIYGLYAALLLGNVNKKVLVIEFEDKAMLRATYINQARIHNGYHYPRSYSTAIKTAQYFKRFCHDFDFAINKKFDQVYATSSKFSYTNAEQFISFCKNCNIKCDEISHKKYFKDSMVDGVFLTEEYSVDAHKLREYFTEKLKQFKSVDILYNQVITSIEETKNSFRFKLNNNDLFECEAVLNATYASTNQILDLAGYEGFKIKYEICEVILGKTTDNIKNVGITVMDGPFFSVMPFGLSDFSSLTSVTFTPHKTSYNKLPQFACQEQCTNCTQFLLQNCNLCKYKPQSAYNYMYAIMRKYLNDNIDFYFDSSLYSIKPILMESELDDSRPTVIKQSSQSPLFLSVLSGKINTIYDLEDVLINEKFN